MFLDDLATPALVLDLDRLELNLDWMAHRCRDLGVALRPHIKTHKCIEIGRMQTAAGAKGITVSTLAEAHSFAEHGFGDVTWAFPFIPSRIDEARAIAEQIDLGVVVDCNPALDVLCKSGFPFHVWLKVDCGYHRAGVDPSGELALRLVDAIHAAPELRFAGILSHSGHAYDAGTHTMRAGIAESERATMAAFADVLRARGIADAFDVSVGSTPSMKSVENLDGVTEARPGNYALYDSYQAHLGTCARSDIAVSVLSTVVSSQPGADHCILDAGALTMSKDPGPTEPGRVSFGNIVDDYETGSIRNDAWLTGLSQEHGKVGTALTAGSRVRILPNHSCLTVAEFDEIHVARGDEVVDRWTIRRARG